MAKTKKAKPQKAKPPKAKTKKAAGCVVIGSSKWEIYIADSKKLPMLGNDRRSALNKSRDALAARLAAADIRELIRLSAAGGRHYDVLAYILLVHGLSKAQDPRLTPALRRRWTALLEARVRETYPVSDLIHTPWSWEFWRAADRVAAERYLCNELDIAALAPERANWALSDLARLANSNLEVTAHEGALARLQAIKAAGGPLAAEARRHLERLGLMDPGRLEEVAREWRQKRDRASLNWLTEKYIRRLQPAEGHPIKPVLDLLGKPTRVDDYTFFYETRERTGRASLLLQLYTDTKTQSTLVGWNLK